MGDVVFALNAPRAKMCLFSFKTHEKVLIEKPGAMNLTKLNCASSVLCFLYLSSMN